MKVLFMGTPAFAASSLKALLQAGHEVAAVVTRPDARAGRGLKTGIPAAKQVALDHGLRVLQPTRIKVDSFRNEVRALSPDLIVVVAYGRILPRSLLDIPPKGAVNVHASLLPRYRGAAPVAWAVARGEKETGVTTMRVVEQLDAGDILLQRATRILPEETAGELEDRLAEMGAALLVETLAGLEAGTVEPVPQDESAATYAPILAKSDGLIDWTRDSGTISARVRAFNPWPGAHTPGPPPARRLVRIWRARPSDSAGSPLAPGDVRVVDSGRGLLVGCGHGTALDLLEIQPEGRKRMPADQAIMGRHLKDGDFLGAR